MLFFDILEKKRQNESFGNVKIVSNKSIDLKKVKICDRLSNNFVKPNEQRETCFIYAEARNCRRSQL